MADASLSAAFVAVVAAAVSLSGVWWTCKSKRDEIIQAQLKEVLAKRMELYPRLWRIPQTFLSDWERQEKPVDAKWARDFFRELIDWHAEYGVFLSQDAYMTFGELRKAAQEVVKRCDAGTLPTYKDLGVMDRIYSLGDPKRPGHDPLHYGLATWLKNDLGSYKSPALRV
jgi:hypothetical protein